MVEIIPLWLVNILSFTTVFSVMAAIGTTVTPEVCFEHIRSPWGLIRGLICVLIIVPVIGIGASFAFGLSLPEKVGITLMVIAPGAPLALRRALSSGAHTGFAPTLQIAVAILAVPAVPLWVLVANLVPVHMDSLMRWQWRSRSASRSCCHSRWGQWREGHRPFAANGLGR